MSAVAVVSPKHQCPEFTDAEIAGRAPHFFALRHVLMDPVRNLIFRKYVVSRGSHDLGFRRRVREMCREDCLFFCCLFGVMYGAKDKYLDKFHLTPFVPYPFQVSALLALRDVLLRRGGDDSYSGVVTLKSRDMGASYMHLFVIAHAWMFHRHFSALLTSREASLVDDKKNVGRSLLPKIDWLLQHAPSWIVPDRERNQNRLTTVRVGNIIHGATTTPNTGRSMRDDVHLYDEYDFVPGPTQDAIAASSGQATGVRMYLSTLSDQNAHFKRLCRNRRYLQLRLHWSAHPRRAGGLYRFDDDGRLELLDVAFWLARANNKRAPDTAPYVAADIALVPPERWMKVFHYEFIRSARFPLRSFFFDRRCEEAENDNEIAREEEMEAGDAGARVFPDTLIDHQAALNGQPPIHRGRLVWTGALMDDIRFVEDALGPLHLWCQLVNGKPSTEYVYLAAADISAGTGASNSSCPVLNRNLREQVAELTSSTMDSKEFAAACVALARWFHGYDSRGALLAWESNGPPGRNFGQMVKQLRYGNVYYKRDETKQNPSFSDQPGFGMSQDVKGQIADSYRRALYEETVIIRSLPAWEEHRGYVYTGATVEFTTSSLYQDPSGAGKWHGDRVIGIMIGVYLMDTFPAPLRKRRPERSEKTLNTSRGRCLLRPFGALREGKRAQGWLS